MELKDTIVINDQIFPIRFSYKRGYRRTLIVEIPFCTVLYCFQKSQTSQLDKMLLSLSLHSTLYFKKFHFSLIV